MTGVKVSKYKKTISIMLLVLCFSLLLITAIGLIAQSALSNTVTIKTESGNVKLVLLNDVKKEDNSIEKLSSKIEISSHGVSSEFGSLVKITSNSVMFDMSIDNISYYFSAINKNIKRISKEIYISTAGDITISNKSELKGFRDNVNSGSMYINDTIKLTSNIDLSNEQWRPIGYENAFHGTFDGNNHTISNIKIESLTSSDYTNTSSYAKAAGFFGNIMGGKVKNLALDNVSINLSKSKLTSYVGCLVGCVYGQVSITNCAVKNSTITLVQGSSDDLNAGGLIGGTKWYNNDNGWINISSCSVDCDISITTQKESDFASAGEVVGFFDAYNGSVSVNESFFSGKLVVKSDGKAARFMVASGIVGFGNGYSASQTSVKISKCMSKVTSGSSVSSGTKGRCFAIMYSGCYTTASAVIIFGTKIVGYSWYWTCTSSYYMPGATYTTGNEANGDIDGDVTGNNKDYNGKLPTSKSFD